MGLRECVSIWIWFEKMARYNNRKLYQGVKMRLGVASVVLTDQSMQLLLELGYVSERQLIRELTGRDTIIGGRLDKLIVYNVSRVKVDSVNALSCTGKK